MRMFPMAVIAGLCGLSAAFEASAQRPSDSAEPELRTFQDSVFGFQVKIPASMRVDTVVQKIFDKHSSFFVHSWAFIAQPAPGQADPHWQRVLINAVQGLGINDLEWHQHAAARREGMRNEGGGGAVVENVVRWRADTAEFLLGVRNAVTGEFINERCLASRVGRQRSAVICVHTVAERQEALASVRESLALTPLQSAPAAK